MGGRSSPGYFGLDYLERGGLVMSQYLEVELLYCSSVMPLKIERRTRDILGHSGHRGLSVYFVVWGEKDVWEEDSPYATNDGKYATCMRVAQLLESTVRPAGLTVTQEPDDVAISFQAGKEVRTCWKSCPPRFTDEEWEAFCNIITKTPGGNP